MWKGWARLAAGVWYRELESMDDESTPPIWTEEFAISVILFSGPLKPGGGAINSVSGGSLRVEVGRVVGKDFNDSTRRFSLQPRWRRLS